MSAVSVLVRDLKTDRIVHIEEVAEGYSDCVCPSCGERMLSANRNADTRQVATYFRHAKSRTCTSETALHLYAKQVIVREKKVVLPAFQTAIEFNNLYRQFNIPSYLAQLNNIELEKSLPNSSRIPDVSSEEIDGYKLFIEIKVHHEVDGQKASELKVLGLDVIEIDLHELVEKKRLSKSDIDKAVIEEAPRIWVSHQRFTSRIENMRAELEKEVNCRKKAAKRASKTRRKNKSEGKTAWRLEHENLLDLIDRYSKVENRKNALDIMKRRLSNPRKNEHGVYQWLLNQVGYIPDIVNMPVKGELAFGVHRICWQTLIFRDIIWTEYDKTAKKIASQKNRSRKSFYDDELDWLDEANIITPKKVYEYLKSVVSFNSIAEEFEKIAGEQLNENYSTKPKTIKYVMVEEYELLPKPVPTIRRYLMHLVRLGILESSGDSYCVPLQSKPTLKKSVQSYSLIVDEGMKQYL